MYFPSGFFVQRDTGMNASDSGHHWLSNFQADYNDNIIRLILYDGIRCLQMVIGIIGNGMTLKILRNLKQLKNGHILMIYLAVSDILVNCMVPFATFIAASRSSENTANYWKTMCLVKEYFYTTTSAISVICYNLLSVDR